MKFLDEGKPIYTCTEKSCENCDVQNAVTCHFTARHLLSFLLVALPAFVLGGIGTFMYAWWAFVIFFASMPLYFGFLEIRVMCSHCPHYAEPETRTLTCWANYGSPKIWRYRPGPMSFWEKVFFLAGMFTVVFIPVMFMILDGTFTLMWAYLAYVTFCFIMLLTFLCTRCMTFACPFNRTKKDVRKKFFSHNPRAKGAWEKDKERL